MTEAGPPWRVSSKRRRGLLYSAWRGPLPRAGCSARSACVKIEGSHPGEGWLPCRDLIKLLLAVGDYAEEAVAGEVVKIRAGIKVKLHAPSTAIRLRKDNVP